jgi:N-acetylglutamate synthase-like GNAT family acetyltransferase
MEDRPKEGPGPASEIRLATESDLQDISDLINLTYSGYSGKRGWTSEVDLISGQKVTPKSIENNKCIIIKKNGKLVGSVFSEPRFESDCLYIFGLTVRPEWQNKKIGSDLLFAAEIAARIEKLSKTEVTVLSPRKELLDWYKRRGYKDYGVRMPVPENIGIPKVKDLEFVVLTKDLNCAT